GSLIFEVLVFDTPLLAYVSLNRSLVVVPFHASQTGCHHRGWFRRPDGRAIVARCRRAAHRPHQSSSVSTAALSGGHLRAVSRRYCLAVTYDLSAAPACSRGHG